MSGTEEEIKLPAEDRGAGPAAVALPSLEERLADLRAALKVALEHRRRRLHPSTKMWKICTTVPIIEFTPNIPRKAVMRQYATGHIYYHNL